MWCKLHCHGKGEPKKSISGVYNVCFWQLCSGMVARNLTFEVRDGTLQVLLRLLCKLSNSEQVCDKRIFLQQMYQEDQYTVKKTWCGRVPDGTGCIEISGGRDREWYRGGAGWREKSTAEGLPKNIEQVALLQA